MAFKSRKIILTILGFFLLGLLISAYQFHYRGKWAVADYKQALFAQGEILDVEQLIPEPVPPGQNGADAFRQVMVLLTNANPVLENNTPRAMRPIMPGRAIAGWMQPDVHNDEITNTWLDIKLAIDKNRETLQLLQQVAERPKLDIQLNYKRGWMMFLPHLAPLKKSMLRLNASAICSLHEGDIGSATANIQSALALIKGIGDEPVAISQLVRIAMANSIMAANWDLLQATNLTDGQLAGLQHDWEELEFTRAAVRALLMERASADAMAVHLTSFGGEFGRLFGAYFRTAVAQKHPEDIPEQWWKNTIEGYHGIWWQWAWAYPDELRSLKGYDFLLTAARRAETNGYFEPALREQINKLSSLGIVDENDDGDIFSPSGPRNLQFLLSSSMLGLRQFLSRVERVEFAKRSTIIALALKRYRLKQGHNPASLTELTPDFLPTIPFDPVDGRPLRYQRKADGSFLLYSIGEDGQDDGGNPNPSDQSKSPSWQNGRDWVWPQPATTEEIAKYQQRATSHHN